MENFRASMEINYNNLLAENDPNKERLTHWNNLAKHK